MYEITQSKLVRSLGVTLMLLFTASCSSWNFYAVESKYTMSEHESAEPEVTETGLYKSMHSKFRRVAVRAPDGCANETSSQSRGEALSQDAVLLKSNCGQEMAILERQLAIDGYRVISWKIIEAKSRAENRPPLDIAKEMGADIIFQINSLERHMTRAGADLRWDRRFYKSNKKWKIGDSAKVNEKTKNQIVRHAQVLESESNFEKTSVSLSATVAETTTGEAIWFYEWTLADTGGSESSAATSFSACSTKDGRCKPWPRRSQKTSGEEELSSGTSVAESVTGFEDERRAKHYTLVKQMVSNMVGVFRRGTSSK